MSKQNFITRRDFIRKTAAFAVSAPYVIAHSAGQAAPSDRIVMGTIGPGMQGKGLLRQFMGFPDTQMVAVCDVSTIRRENARDLVERRYAREKKSGTFKGCAMYKDFRKLLARKDIDAVIIAVPDHWHAIPVITAAKEGKDVYCEKPLSLTIREARAMANAVRKYKRVFQTGSQQRSENEGRFHRACELVRNGRIGKITQVNVGVGGPSRDCDLPEEPVPPGLDWNFWLGPAPYRGYNKEICPPGLYNFFPNWRNYKDYSGGMMTDWGAHHFDIAQWGLGMDNSGPVEIIPPSREKGTPLTYRYANGVMMYHGGADGVKFTGTKGVIEVNRGHLRIQPESIATEVIGPDEIHLYKTNNHKRNFLDCVHSRKLPICDVEIGCRSVTVCHLGNLAWWNNRRLRWDPNNERFIGDAQANTWLDRPKRAPWKLPTI